MKFFLKNVLVLLSVVLLSACDLSLQKSFDFDEDAHLPVQPPYNTTIWDYMTHPQDTTFDQNDELDSMVVAVKRGGMENIYTEGSKTVFLLRNKAMQEFLSDEGYNSIGEVPINTLKNLLKYHVINRPLKQRDLNIGKYYVFQTLIDGDDGLINLWEFREYWRIQLNSGGPDLPSTAKSAIVYLHNFEFKNGEDYQVAHQLNTYARRVPFDSIGKNNFISIKKNQ